MGWWPSKIIVLLNIVQMVGYGLIDCVVGGQILSAVSPDYHMSVAVGMLSIAFLFDTYHHADNYQGIVIVAVITWFIATFGIKFFHLYERYVYAFPSSHERKLM